MPDHASVAGVAEKDGAYLMVRRVPGGPRGGRWEFPGGKIEPGETPQQALRREWDEELGLEVSVGEQIARGSFENRGRTFSLRAFRVRLGDGEPQMREHDLARWVSPGEMARMDIIESDLAVVKALSGNGG